MAKPLRNGLTDAIRSALATGKLSPAEVAEAVRKQGIDVEEKNVRSILNQREQIGEFAREVHAGRVRFFLNPKYKPARSGRPGASAGALAPSLGVAAAPQPKAGFNAKRLAAKVEEYLIENECTLHELQDLFCDHVVGRHHLIEALTEGIAAGRLISRTEDRITRYTCAVPGAGNPVPAAGVVVAVPVVDAPAVRVAASAPAPSNLRQRVDVIRQDIEDAIADACDAELPHALIKALVRAGGEVRRASEQLVA